MESGLRLTDRYRLVERLDDGGTMEVWRAWDELLGRPVAVKLLTPDRADLREAFQEGVNRAAGLSHAALETVYDSDRTRDASGRLASFVVTEYLGGGETLAERLRRGPLTASEAADACGRIAAALEAAHAAGVPHGDLRPDKVMLTCDEVKVVDVGIGGIVRTARGPAGDGARLALAADARTADVRALGAVISACLPPGASGELPALAARCLGAHPPSAGEVADLLAGDDGPPNAAFAAPGAAAPRTDQRTRAMRPPPPAPRARRPSGTGVRVAAAALVVAIPATAAAAILMSAPRSPVTVPPPARSDAAAPPAAPPSAPPGAGPRATDPSVTNALGRLRPIVSRGYASGQIRSDVAIDLNNVITNLENDLTSNRNVDVNQRIASLRDKITTRRRERGLSPDLADELSRVLATVQA